jgi:hypothetical protein
MLEAAITRVLQRIGERIIESETIENVQSVITTWHDSNLRRGRTYTPTVPEAAETWTLSRRVS